VFVRSKTFQPILLFVSIFLPFQHVDLDEQRDPLSLREHRHPPELQRKRINKCLIITGVNKHFRLFLFYFLFCELSLEVGVWHSGQRKAPNVKKSYIVKVPSDSGQCYNTKLLHYLHFLWLKFHGKLPQYLSLPPMVYVIKI